MTDKVTQMPSTQPQGMDAAARAQPHPKIVMLAERMAELARNGTIQAIAIAFVDANGEPYEVYSRGAQNERDCHGLMAAISYLQVRYACDINDNDNVVETNDPGPKAV